MFSGTQDHDAPSIVLPHQDASYIRHIALDIGGSLIKLVYFSSDEAPVRTSSGGSSRHTGGIALHKDDALDSCLPFLLHTLVSAV